MHLRSNFAAAPVRRLAIYVVTSSILVCAQPVLAATLQGAVTDLADAPLGGICLDLVDQGTGTFVSVRSNGAGRYTFDLSPGAYLLETRTECVDSPIAYENRYWASEGPTVYQWDRTTIIVSEGDALTGFDFQLAAGRQIKGRVTGPSGAAEADRQVELYGGSCWNGRLREVQTDANGDYVANVRSGEVFALIFPECSLDADPVLHSTWWSSDGGTQSCPQATPVPDGEDSVGTNADFQLDEAAIVTGTIKAEDGSIVEGVLAQAFSGPNWEGFLQDTPPDPATGRYVLCLSEGDGDVYVRAFFGNNLNQPPETDPEASDATRYASEWWDNALSLDEQDPVAVVAGSSVTIDFSLRTAGYVTGVVTDRDSGAPLAGIGVGAYAKTCYQEAPSGAVSWVGDAVTNEDGRYYLWTAEPVYLVSCDDNCIDGGTPFDGVYEYLWYDGTGAGSADCQDAMLLTPGAPAPAPEHQGNLALPVRDAGQLTVVPNDGYQGLIATDNGVQAPPPGRYTVRNPGGRPFDFKVSTTVDWLNLVPAQGQLEPGGEVEVVVSVGDSGLTLARNRTHQASILFENLTDGTGNTARAASVLLVDGAGTGWGVSTSEGFDDTTSLAAEDLPAGGIAELKLLVDTPTTPQSTPAAAAIPDINLSFQARTAIGPEDRFTVSVAGELVKQWSGVEGWQPACLPLSACAQFPCEITFVLQTRQGADSTPTSPAVYVDNITTTPSVRIFSAILPGSRSAQIGTSVTAFATLINGGTEAGDACAIRPVTPVSGAFSYQITDSDTNAAIGISNVPRDVPANAKQSFVFAFTPDAAMDPTDVELRFDCANSCGPSPTVTGLNTFLLSASPNPVPDIVALVATLDGDGIVKIPGIGSTGVLSVASVNVGIGGPIQVSADTGTASLPVNLSICETNPQSGVCLGDPAASVSTSIAADATPTFGVFVTASAAVPFDPGANRIFVRFRDQAGVVRGATGVAVRTQ